LRLINAGHDLVYTPEIRARHLVEPSVRPSSRIYYTFTRNALWVALRNHRAARAAASIVQDLALMGFCATRAGELRAYARGLLDLRRWYQQAGRLALVVAGVGALMAFTTAGITTYTVIELHRFGRAEARRATFVYAAGQPLAPGISVRAVDLAGTLTRLKYRETSTMPPTPGHFRRTAGVWA